MTRDFMDHFGMCDRPHLTSKKNPLDEHPERLKSPRLIRNSYAMAVGCAAFGGGTTTQSRTFTHTHDEYGNPITQPEFITTNQAANDNMFANKAWQKPSSATKTKRIIPHEVALQERLATYMPGGEPPDALTFKIGDTCKPNIPKMAEETTNQYFYSSLPEQRMSEQPELFHNDREFGHKATIKRELKANQNPSPVNENRRRGELTRNPKESGNPYGVSVYVDEYAKWGTALLGQTRGECREKACTKYF